MEIMFISHKTEKPLGMEARVFFTAPDTLLVCDEKLSVLK
jgi:hypothetical protein